MFTDSAFTPMTTNLTLAEVRRNSRTPVWLITASDCNGKVFRIGTVRYHWLMSSHGL